MKRHRFDVSFERARAIQDELRGHVRTTPLTDPIRKIAAADVSFTRRAPHLFGAVVVVDAESGEELERVSARSAARFPYVPGYLSFRELPCLLRAFEKLRCQPDLVIADGHGWAHPRRFGLACHLGVLLDIPTLGCAKSPLVGSYREPGLRRGAHTALRDGGETIGEVLRTRTGVKPVFLSVGHRVTLGAARAWVLRTAQRYRLPEPSRAAHREANRARRRAAGAPGNGAAALR